MKHLVFVMIFASPFLFVWLGYAFGRRHERLGVWRNAVARRELKKFQRKCEREQHDFMPNEPLDPEKVIRIMGADHIEGSRAL